MNISLFKISRDKWLFFKIIIYNFHQVISLFIGQSVLWAPHTTILEVLLLIILLYSKMSKTHYFLVK